MKLTLQIGAKSDSNDEDTNTCTNEDANEGENGKKNDHKDDIKTPKTSKKNNQEAIMAVVSKKSKILHFVSKLLVLVIISTVFTLLFMIMMAVRMTSDKLGHWPQTLQSLSFAVDMFIAMFAVYTQFGFGEWIYKATCWKCHLPVFYKFAKTLPVQR